MHEKEREVRRSHGYARPADEYETYRYVEAPRSEHNPRASRDSYSRVRSNLIVEDNRGHRVEIRR